MDAHGGRVSGGQLANASGPAMYATELPSGAVVLQLPGEFIKVRKDGRTVVRAHAMQDGTWHVTLQWGEPPRTVASEQAATTLVALAAVLM